jgi:hypothetical protein
MKKIIMKFFFPLEDDPLPWILGYSYNLEPTWVCPCIGKMTNVLVTYNIRLHGNEGLKWRGVNYKSNPSFWLE